MAKKPVKEAFLARPPIVAVLGHVDHGKTTLLDFIRKANVAGGEHGGITQHIGAYQIELPKTKHKITFIDTPGHEAFIKMRSRGAAVADFAILVVDATDSVMPQTIESIKQIKTAGIPMIVAANKIDLPTAQLDKLKSDLAKNDVQVEGFGGDVPIVPVSAKTGKGVPELLDLIELMAEMKELKNETALPFSGVVIETRLDKGKGMVATVIVKTGVLKFGSVMFSANIDVGKVRAMFDEKNQAVSEAPPGKPVEILGFKIMPAVGAVLTAIPQAEVLKVDLKTQINAVLTPDFLNPIDAHEMQKLTIILKTDTAGSLEAIISSLDPRIVIVNAGIGDINEADILLAKSSHAIVIGFNVKANPSVIKLAQTEKVIHRTYQIIYEMLDELSEVVAGLKEVLAQERELGQGQIIAEFPFDNQRIAGTRVVAGRIARGDSVKLMRADVEIIRAKIKSLKHGKDEVNKAEVKAECGILFDRQVDFKLGDVIIAVTTA